MDGILFQSNKQIMKGAGIGKISTKCESSTGPEDAIAVTVNGYTPVRFDIYTLRPSCYVNTTNGQKQYYYTRQLNTPLLICIAIIVFLVLYIVFRLLHPPKSEVPTLSY